MECVAYLRVSTEKQAEEGNGLESQKRDILNFAKKEELIITKWFVDDGYTGTNMNRPALQRLIGECVAKKITCIVAFKLDRLSRSMIDGLYLIERVFQPNGVKFLCVHDSISYDSPMEQAYTQMMAVFAQLDKNTMMLRMRGGMLERVKQGYWPGGGNTPFCYRYDKELGILVPIRERSELANKALDLFIDGYSDRKIKDILEIRNEHTVYQVLTGVVNIGMIPYKGNIYRGRHEPIFDKEKYEYALNLRKNRRKKRYTFTDHLLSGLCYCGKCGCAMRYQNFGKPGYKIYCLSRSKDKSYLPNWNANCDSGTFSAKYIEDQVRESIKKIALNASLKSFDKKNPSDILKDQIKKETSKLKRLYDLYSDSDSGETILEVIREKEKTISKLKKELEEEEPQAEYKKSFAKRGKEIKELSDIWDEASIPDKNKILKTFVKKIVISEDKVDIVLKDF